MATKKPKPPFDREKRLKAFVIAALRRASYRWPPRYTAKINAKISYGLYECQACKKAFGPKQINLDHKIPVVSIKDGFTNFNDYIERLFCDVENFSVLCLFCHEQKTAVEDAQRSINKKAKKSRK